jgi:MinD-like ATPase involved in chromosome partitioning or flagellar assembly
VDADLHSPSAHIILGLEHVSIQFTLNDYLNGECRIEQAVYDVTPKLGVPVIGQVLLMPGSTDPLKIMHILRQGYDIAALTDGYKKLIEDFSLDYLLLDATAGINDGTLASFAVADALVLVLRLDRQGYQGTAVLFEIARKMSTARMFFVVNDVPAMYSVDEIATRVTETYNCPPDFIIPHSDKILALASAGIFSLRYPDHPVTGIFKKLTAKLMQ